MKNQNITHPKIFTVAMILLISAIAHAYTTTSNMSLKSPAAGDTDYPTSISDSFTLIDAHDHTTGKGVQIPSGGLAANSVINGKISTAATDASTIEISSGTLRVKDAGITKSKLSALNIQTSSNCGSASGSDFLFTTNSGTPVDVTSCTLAITGTTGRSISIDIVPRASATQFSAFEAGSASECYFLLLKDGTVISLVRMSAAVAAVGSPSATAKIYIPANFHYVDTVASGSSATYKLQAYNLGSDFCSLWNTRLQAYEL